MLQGKLSTIGIIAADTFRSGAIEQLITHGKKLGIDEKHLFTREYGRDQAAVVREGLYRLGALDAILVDTAGRFLYEKGKCDTLCKMVNFALPCYIFLIVECTMGNSIIKLIEQFNDVLQGGCNGKQINSVIFTKVDIADDKIGSLINVASTLKTSSPSTRIDYICTGQGYDDIYQVDTNKIINLL